MTELTLKVALPDVFAFDKFEIRSLSFTYQSVTNDVAAAFFIYNDDNGASIEMETDLDSIAWDFSKIASIYYNDASSITRITKTIIHNAAALRETISHIYADRAESFFAYVHRFETPPIPEPTGYRIVQKETVSLEELYNDLQTIIEKNKKGEAQ